MAADPKTAAGNFLSALDTMPALIDKYKADNEKLARDVPTLKAVVEEVWKKEDELKGLKTELVTMERKIEASLNPITNSVGISGEIPKEDTGAKSESLQVPERVQAARDSFEERVITTWLSHGAASPPEKKGFKIQSTILSYFDRTG